MKKLIAAMSAAALIGLLSPVIVSAEEEHEEETLNVSDVPAAVQKAAESEAKGGRIVRWEKEGKAYEAVIEKDRKQWGYVFDKHGKKLGKHNESKEKGEKHEG